MAKRVTETKEGLIGLAESYLAQKWLAENPGSMGANPVPPDMRPLARQMVESGQITAQTLAPFVGGTVNPDGTLTYDADTSRDWSGDLLLGAAMGAVGMAGLTGGFGTTAAQGLGNIATHMGVPAESLPTWMQPTAGGVADTGFGAGIGGGGPSPGMGDYAARVAAEDLAGGANYLATQGQTYPQFLQSLTAAGVPAAVGATVASNVAKGFGLKEAMSLAGIAAPIIGAVLGSSAIENASGAQQEATNAAIGQIRESVSPALEGITAAQLAGVGEQNAALDEGLRLGQETYGRGVGEQKNALAIARGDLAPWREAGSAAITNLGNLVNDPNSSLMRKFTVADFMDDPVTKLSFQTGLDTGTKALQSSARSRGTLNSGGTLKALTKFGTDYTGNQAGASRDRFVGDQNNTYSRLMGVSDAGQRAVTEGNQFGMGVANNISNAGNLMATNAAQLRAGTASNIANSGNVAATNKANIQIGAGNSIANLLGAQGNARGAAAIAQGNTLSGAANSIGNWWSSQETLDKILAARK